MIPKYVVRKSETNQYIRLTLLKFPSLFIVNMGKGYEGLQTLHTTKDAFVLLKI